MIDVNNKERGVEIKRKNKDKEKAKIVWKEILLNFHYNSTLFLQNVKCYIYLDLIVAKLSLQIPPNLHSNTYLTEPIILESMCLIFAYVPLHFCSLEQSQKSLLPWLPDVVSCVLTSSVF